MHDVDFAYTGGYWRRSASVHCVTLAPPNPRVYTGRAPAPCDTTSVAFGAKLECHPAIGSRVKASHMATPCASAPVPEAHFTRWRLSFTRRRMRHRKTACVMAAGSSSLAPSLWKAGRQDRLALRLRRCRYGRCRMRHVRLAAGGQGRKKFSHKAVEIFFLASLDSPSLASRSFMPRQRPTRPKRRKEAGKAKRKPARCAYAKTCISSHILCIFLHIITSNFWTDKKTFFQTFFKLFS